MNKASGAARAKWARIIAAQGRSGMSAARFCDERGIWASSFFSWKRKLADAGEGRAAFVEAQVEGVDGDRRGGIGGIGGIAIELAQGRRLIVGRGFDRQLLLEVIEALEPAGGEA